MEIEFDGNVPSAEAKMIPGKHKLIYISSPVYENPQICDSWTVNLKPMEGGMEPIKSKRALHRKIKEILETDPCLGMEFPQVISFSKGMGQPRFKITIEMNHEDYFIDEKGQKWVKAQ